MDQFIINKEYKMSSVCDCNCIWSYTVLSRTAKTIKLLSDRKELLTRRIKTYKGTEYCMPLGNYSMAPILSADGQY